MYRFLFIAIFLAPVAYADTYLSFGVSRIKVNCIKEQKGLLYSLGLESMLNQYIAIEYSWKRSNNISSFIYKNNNHIFCDGLFIPDTELGSEVNTNYASHITSINYRMNAISLKAYYPIFENGRVFISSGLTLVNRNFHIKSNVILDVDGKNYEAHFKGRNNNKQLSSLLGVGINYSITKKTSIYVLLYKLHHIKNNNKILLDKNDVAKLFYPNTNHLNCCDYIANIGVKFGIRYLW